MFYQAADTTQLSVSHLSRAEGIRLVRDRPARIVHAQGASHEQGVEPRDHLPLGKLTARSVGRSAKTRTNTNFVEAGGGRAGGGRGY